MEPREQKTGINWQKGASAVICVAAGVLAVWLIFKYALGIALPFLLAWLLSGAVKPLAARICGRTHMPRGLCAGMLVLLLVGGTVFLAISGIRRGVDELGRLVEELATDTDGLVAAVGDVMEKARSLSAHIPFLRHFEETPGYAELCARLDGLVEAGATRLVESVSARLPDAAVTVAGWLPSAFLFIMVMLLSCYYFSADDGRLGQSMHGASERLLPQEARDLLSRLRRRLGRLGKQYGRAYLLLGLLTFLEMFIGLTVLGVSYAFILAWVIALVDFLPLLGTGAVLVPWAIVCFLMGNSRTGFGLLILYGVSLLVRQIAEPKLVGKGLGLHPLVALVATYTGLKLFGLLGMILAPLVAAGVRSMVEGDGGQNLS